MPNKRAYTPINWPASSESLSTFSREGFNARYQGKNRSSNPYAFASRATYRPDLAQQHRQMAEEWWRGWDEAHLHQ